MYKIPPDNLNSPYVHAIRDKPDGKHATLVPNTIGFQPQRTGAMLPSLSETASHPPNFDSSPASLRDPELGRRRTICWPCYDTHHLVH
jgi:hypothetical protein